MTNLAIKGIVGIAAMAEMSDFMGNAGDSQQYNVCQLQPYFVGVLLIFVNLKQANASSYIKLWESLASNSGHLLPTYDSTDSSAYALMYNMYADRLLQTNLIDQSVRIRVFTNPM